jgi:carboxymethylenebutenolidase
MLEEIVDITTQDGAMGVIVKHPDGSGPFPVVLLFHDGPGVREATHSVVRRFAQAGYYVVAPDRYYRHGRFVHVEPEALIAAGPDSQLMHDFFRMVMSTTDDCVRNDVDALLDHLISVPLANQGWMGCVGYCDGARAVLRTMSERPTKFVAGVGLHPSFCVSPDDDSPHLCVSSVKGQLYFAIGEADHLATVDHNRPLIDELRKLGDRATVEILAGADHGFAVPGPNYHAAAATQSHAKAIELFERTLR